MSKHTPSASAPAVDQIHCALLRLSLAIGTFADMPEEERREIAGTIALLGERPEQMKAAELANLIASTWDAAAAKASTPGASAPDLDTLRLCLDGHRRLIVQGTNRLTALAFAIHDQADGHPLLQELAQILADEASHLVETIMDDFEDLTERLGLSSDGKEGEQ